MTSQVKSQQDNGQPKYQVDSPVLSPVSTVKTYWTESQAGTMSNEINTKLSEQFFAIDSERHRLNLYMSTLRC